MSGVWGHTPTPWIAERSEKSASITLYGKRLDGDARPLDGLGWILDVDCALNPDDVAFSPFNPESEANAAFIVQACNSYDAHISVLEAARNVLANVADTFGVEARQQVIAQIDTALSRVSGSIGGGG